MRYEVWLGLRYLFAKRQERFISVIAALSIGGVALGVAALLIVIPVMSGFHEELKNKLIGINAHLIVDSPEGLRDIQPLMRQLSAMDHVVGVSPFIVGQAILALPHQPLGVVVRGMDPQREMRVSRWAEYVVVGKLPEDENEILIGSVMSQALSAGPNDAVQLISPVDGRTHALIISGVFRSGMYASDSGLVGLSLSKAQQLYHMEGRVSGLGVKLDELEKAPAMKRKIQAGLGPAYSVKTWMDLDPALFGAIRMEKILIFIFLLLIIVVAALNIASMLIMIVMEKTKDIGILRTLGATRSSIAWLFFSQGCAIGFFGICLGLIVGLSVTGNVNGIASWLERTFGISVFPPEVYYLDHIPVQVNSTDVVIVLVSVFLLTLLAGVYPALRAASLAPADALRYE